MLPKPFVQHLYNHTDSYNIAHMRNFLNMWNSKYHCRPELSSQLSLPYFRLIWPTLLYLWYQYIPNPATNLFIGLTVVIGIYNTKYLMIYLLFLDRRHGGGSAMLLLLLFSDDVQSNHLFTFWDELSLATPRYYI